MKISAVWNGGKSFVASAEGMRPVEMGWGEGKSDMSPMELLLSSLAGCTGIDVVDILRKMREEISKVEVLVEGRRREEHPRIWESVDVGYHIHGKNVDAEKAQRAVTLSVEKYCSVSAMFSSEVRVTHHFELYND